MGLRLIETITEKFLKDGDLFSVSHFVTGVTDGSEVDIRLTTPAGPTISLIGVIISGTGDGDIEFFENGTISAGTTLTPLDLNRLTANSSATVVTHTPTVSAEGTSLFKALLIGGQRNSAIPAEFSNQAAMILKKSEDYLLRITNESAATSDYSIRFVFAEVA